VSAPLNMLAEHLVEGGKLGDAVRAAELNAELHPDATFAHSTLGDLYARQGTGTKAIEAMKKALAVDPNNGWARKRLGTRERKDAVGLASDPFLAHDGCWSTYTFCRIRALPRSLARIASPRPVARPRRAGFVLWPEPALANLPFILSVATAAASRTFAERAPPLLLPPSDSPPGPCTLVERSILKERPSASTGQSLRCLLSSWTLDASCCRSDGVTCPPLALSAKSDCLARPRP